MDELSKAGRFKSDDDPPRVTEHLGSRAVPDSRVKKSERRQFRPILSKTWPLIVLGVIVLTFIASVWGADVNHMTDLGFLSVLPPAAYAALAVLIIATCILIFHQPDDSYPLEKSQRVLT